MIFDQFDRIRVVNLRHRRDRRNQMNRQLAKVGLLGDPRVSYQKAYQFSDALNFRTAGLDSDECQRVRMEKYANGTKSSAINRKNSISVLSGWRKASEYPYGGM
jgi:hypothetical protein